MKPSFCPSPNILLTLTLNLLSWMTKQLHVLAQVLAFKISVPFHSPSITILSTAKNKINSELSASQHTRNTLLSPVGLISTMVYLTIILLLSNQSKTLVPKQSLMLEGLILPRSSCLSCIGSLSICVRSTKLF